MPPRRRTTQGESRRSTRGGATPRRSGSQQVSDDDMADAPSPEANTQELDFDSAAATPGQDGDQAGEDDDALPMQADDDDDDNASSPRVVQSIPRRRRGPGRPPKGSRMDSQGLDDDASDSGTPRKRRGPGRPSTGGRGGFRGRPKWGKRTETDRQPIDKLGNTVQVIDDEADLPEDPAGEDKVDRSGNLQDGRDYRVRVFTVMGRAKRLYMLSTEPARCLGFRDSYLFFNKHLSLHKIVCTEAEKMDLIERDVLPHSYKGRSIGCVTARSVFREFGARIIIGGKRVTDDYYEAQARANGEVEGELADPHDRLPPPGEPYNKNQYVAWHGASQVYHTQPTGSTIPTAKQLVAKRRTNITVGNWQTEHATEASKFNSSLTALRRANLDGVYDTHTNLLFIPKIMQPTHIKWSPAPTSTAVQPLPSPPSSPPAPSFFPAVPSVVANNYAVVDTILTPAPPGHVRAVVPGPDGSGADGLAGVPDDVRAELPPECRAAFDVALREEQGWRDRWRGEGGEGGDGLRGKLRVGYARFPTI